MQVRPLLPAPETAAFSRRFFLLKRGIVLSKNLKAVIAALLGYSIFGFSFLFSKTALEFASPFGLLGLRFLLAFLALNFVLLFGKTKISLKGKPIGSLDGSTFERRFGILPRMYRGGNKTYYR